MTETLLMLMLTGVMGILMVVGLVGIRRNKKEDK